tara:strand:+ start:136 stop:1326 length:1191 start_codon:yes stop_codon:yes gene_type:complete
MSSRLIVNSIRHTGASGDAVTLANDGTCTANITNNLSNRNKVINGSMICSQRGTTFSPTGTNQIYTLDRFQHVTTGGADGDCTVTQSTDAAVGFKNSYKITPDATNTPTGGGNVTIRHQIEGQDLQDLAYGTSSAKSLTISFYAKTASANSGDQYTLCLFYSRQDATQKTVTVAFTPTSTYQRFSFTFAGDTDATYGMRNDNGSGMTLVWVLAAGPNDITAAKPTWEVDGGYFRGVTGQSNFMDNTSNEFYLTGVQLEVDHTGSGKATDFEHRSFAHELALCQRYYFNIKGNNDDFAGCSGYAVWHDVQWFSVLYPVPMRSQPTYTGTSTAARFYSHNASNNFNLNQLVTNTNTADTSSFKSMRLFNNGTAGSSEDGLGGELQFQATGTMEFSSEL